MARSNELTAALKTGYELQLAKQMQEYRDQLNQRRGRPYPSAIAFSTMEKRLKALENQVKELQEIITLLLLERDGDRSRKLELDTAVSNVVSTVL